MRDANRRAPFQVLVLPYRRGSDGTFEYALFHRADHGYWQGIAGGGEGSESPVEAARREAFEEAGIAPDRELLPLVCMTMIPVVDVTGDLLWGDDVLEIPEHVFAVECGEIELVVSHEHTEARWFSFDEGLDAVHWDSNRTALHELDTRLRRAG